MLNKQAYPILEYDSNPLAIINPKHHAEIKKILPDFPDKLVITFFKDVILQLLEEKKIALYHVVHGENDIQLYRFVDSDVLILHGTIGCPACAGYLDELIGMGIQKVMFCGGGGVLHKEITVGKFLVVEGAIRDEGFSYHYVPPSRIIYAQKEVNEKICDYLTSQKIDHLCGLVWTTDAFYRETPDRVALRKEEGALIVEMEQSGCLAVTQFRGVQYGAIIYGGDDVSGTQWDNRGWMYKKDVRYHLVSLCKDLVLKI